MLSVVFVSYKSPSFLGIYFILIFLRKTTTTTEMAPAYSQPRAPRLTICLPCYDALRMEPFPTSIEAIRHVVKHHKVTHPPSIQLWFVKEDVTTISNVVNETVGRNLHNYTIDKHSQMPICHPCNLSLPSWDETICHQIGQHQNTHPWQICQMMGRDLMHYAPQMMKKFKYRCFHCEGLCLFQIPAMLTFHYKVAHKMSEVNAQT